MIYVTLTVRRIRLSEDDADVSKHVAVLTVYKILLLWIYVVHLLVWIINCTRCTVQSPTSKCTCFCVICRGTYRVIHKSVKHLKNSQQIDYATDHGNSYVDREKNCLSFFWGKAREHCCPDFPLGDSSSKYGVLYRKHSTRRWSANAVATPVPGFNPVRLFLMGVCEGHCLCACTPR